MSDISPLPKKEEKIKKPTWYHSFFKFHLTYSAAMPWMLTILLPCVVVAAIGWYVFKEMRWMRRVRTCMKLHDLGWTFFKMSNCGRCQQQSDILGPVCSRILGGKSCDCLFDKSANSYTCHPVCELLKEGQMLYVPMWACLDKQNKQVVALAPGVKTWDELHALSKQPRPSAPQPHPRPQASAPAPAPAPAPTTKTKKRETKKEESE